ncbi:pilin [Parendozoicomonas sp. Alg238-R29]|uniref:pilin n=1 Tax=Parendozoicomonas sp. Alg238-R29 TaxID=2993446 RepID=UPI00248F2690|nr:pilin [Parendozoicomonas sp. Alg238-R29]
MKKQQSGFTLIELMIVIAIIGILAAIAIPQYQNYVSRTNVTAAVTTLATNKAGVEEYVLTYGFFPDNVTAQVDAQADDPLVAGDQSVAFVRGQRPEDLGVNQPSNGAIIFVPINAANGTGYLEFTFNRGTPEVNGNTVRLTRGVDGNWNCTTIIGAEFVGEGCAPLAAY